MPQGLETKIINGFKIELDGFIEDKVTWDTKEQVLEGVISVLKLVLLRVIHL